MYEQNLLIAVIMDSVIPTPSSMVLIAETPKKREIVARVTGQ